MHDKQGAGAKGCENIEKLEKVKLAFYYEARDLDAGRYFNKQLFPFYHVLEDFVDIELLPYGMMKYDTTTYSCPKDFTEASCISNVFQAVVIDKYMGTEMNGDIISGANRAINFVRCLYHQDAPTNVYTTLQLCSDENLEPDEYVDIIAMMNTKPDQFKTIMNNLKMKTENAKITRIPYLTVNGKESASAFNDLIQESCNNYKVTNSSILSVYEHEQLSSYLRYFFLGPSKIDNLR